MTDVALDLYTTHGHDGTKNNVINDKTIDILIRQSLLQAEMEDVPVPSDMMEKSWKIRKFDKNNYQDVQILSYVNMLLPYGPLEMQLTKNSKVIKKLPTTFLTLTIVTSVADIKEVQIWLG